MGDIPRNEAASLSLEAALYDSKSGQFSPAVKQSTSSGSAKQASTPSQSMQQPRQS